MYLRTNHSEQYVFWHKLMPPPARPPVYSIKKTINVIENLLVRLKIEYIA